MTESCCRPVGDQPDRLEKALDESRSHESGWEVFFAQNLDSGECWLLELAADDPVTIGRSDTADLTLGDATVSGRHARLEHHAGALFIKDMRSTNGTYVNEKRVFSQPLAHGDVVRCGGIRLRVVLEGVPRPLTQTVRREDPTRIPVDPGRLIEVYQPEGSLSGPARQALINVTERLAQRAAPFLILDLSRTAAVSSNALELIAELRERLRAQSGDLVLCALTGGYVIPSI